MSVCWMLVVLLGCRLARAAESPSTCPCNVRLKTICRPHTDDVHVPCPNMTAGDMMFHLLKDQEMISNVTCSRENNTLKCTPPHTRGGVALLEENKLVSFKLTGLTNSSQGIYTCEGTVTFPPPIKKMSSALGIQVFEGQSPRNKDSSYNGSDIIWSLVVVLLGIYSVTVTIIAFVTWVKLKKMDSHSDYMNTKPRAAGDRKRKKGVQHPIPHF